MGKTSISILVQRKQIVKQLQQFSKREFFGEDGLNILVKRIIASVQEQSWIYHSCLCHLPGGKITNKELRYCEHLWNHQRYQYERLALAEVLANQGKMQDKINQNIRHSNQQNLILNQERQNQIKKQLKYKLSLIEKMIQILKQYQGWQQSNNLGKQTLIVKTKNIYKQTSLRSYLKKGNTK